MKTLLSVLALGLAVTAAVAATSDATGDLMKEMKNCAVCKAMGDNPELLKQMTWETHKIDNGMICVATVPKEHKEEFNAIHKKMMANIEQVKSDAASGKEVQLCSMCKGMGELEKAGAKMTDIETKVGGIHMVTSDDAAVVAKIHAQADKAIAEQEKLEQAGH